MKILFAHRYDPDFPMGGAARFVLELAVPLRDQPGMEVACITNKGELMDALRKEDVTVYEIPWSRLKTMGIIICMKRAVKEFRPDIYHAHHRYMTFLGDLFLKGETRVLHTEHVLRKDKRALFRYGHFATGVSQAVRDNLVGFYGVPEDLALAIPNAVNLRKVRQDTLSRLEERFGPPGKRALGLCVGRLDEQKGHIYLIEAVSRLSESNRGRLRILLAGDGPLRGTLMDEARRKGVAPNFEFLGHTQDVPELLHLCDVFILPSLWEGMPLSVLEAYQADKPVIATDIPGTREVVLNGSTGVLVPSKNPDALKSALTEFIENRSRFDAMKTEIDRRAKQFSFETMLERYRDLYTRLKQNGTR